MTEKNNPKKFIAALLIILLIAPAVLLSRPKPAQATVPTWDYINGIILGLTGISTGTGTAANVAHVALAVRTYALQVLKQVAMAVAKRALQEMTKSTVNWINSGFHGTPLFLENPDSFFKDIAKNEVKTLVNQFGYDPRRFPFGKQFALNAINSYKSTLDNNAAYSLSTVINDPAFLYNYQNNFATGGWNGFLINTQYPQNNYLGFNMIANQELAKQIAGVNQAPAQKAQNLLQQGMGFLSPQVCPKEINPNYPIATNPYNPPSFDTAAYEKAHPFNPPDFPECATDPEGAACQQSLSTSLALYEAKESGAKTAFDFSNSCTKPDGTSGLINTTPGAVAADQVMTALKIPANSTLQAMGLGNDLSAIFNALLNHFLDKGLNALASKVNPKPPTDNFSYNGLTLGSSDTTAGVNDTWDSGPDQPIVLDDFKKTIADGITNTTKELQMMSSDDPTNPGTAQTIGLIWPKIQKLDACIPGPDIGWQDRVDQEVGRNSIKFQDNANNSNGDTAAKAQLGLKELQFAASLFKDWINNKMMTELPHSINYLSAVNDLKNLAQQATELNDKINVKNKALIILQTIKTDLDGITVQPTPGSTQDALLVSLWKQYTAIADGISNGVTMGDTQTELLASTAQKDNLDKLLTECQAERATKGWSVPGGATSTFSAAQSSLPVNGIPGNSEQSLFCDLPIVGGYSHQSFVNTSGVTYPQIPLVNAKNVSTGAKTTNVLVSCNIIYNATLLDYKGSLPGITPPAAPYKQPPDDTGGDATPPPPPPVTQ
jgi:hypothetical protein